MLGISIIVPVYNTEPYLKRCIDSVLSQTFVDFSLILIDDGSSDASPKICDSYAEKDDRITVIHQENGGVSAARNNGIEWVLENCDSEWLTFIDSDDWVHPQYLQSLLDAAKKYNVGVSACCHKNISEPCASYAPVNSEPVLLSFDEYYDLRQSNSNIVVAWGKLYRKCYFEHVRYPVGRINEDIFTTHRALTQSSGIAFMRDELYYYFINPDSIMHTSWSPARLGEIEGYENLLEFTKTHNYPKAHIRVIETYYWSLDRQIKLLDGNSEYLSHRTMLIKKLKLAIIKYRKLVPVSIRERHWLLDDTYPKLMKVYWLGRAVVNKVQKVIRRGNQK